MAKEIHFLGRLLQLVGQSSLCVHGPVIIHLYMVLCDAILQGRKDIFSHPFLVSPFVMNVNMRA